MMNAADLGAQASSVDVQGGPPMPPDLSAAAAAAAASGADSGMGGLQVGAMSGRPDNKEKRPRRPHRRRSDPEHHKRMQYAIDAVLGQGDFLGRKLSYRDACKAAGDVTLSALHRCVKEAAKNNGRLPMVRSGLGPAQDRAKVRNTMILAEKNAIQMAARELSATAIPSALARGIQVHPFSEDEHVTGGTLNKLISDMQTSISKVAAETASDVAAQVATKAATKAATNAVFHSFNEKVNEIVHSHTLGILSRLAAIEDHLGLSGVGGAGGHDGTDDMRKGTGKRGSHPTDPAGSKKPRHG